MKNIIQNFKKFWVAPAIRTQHRKDFTVIYLKIINRKKTAKNQIFHSI